MEFSPSIAMPCGLAMTGDPLPKSSTVLVGASDSPLLPG